MARDYILYVHGPQAGPRGFPGKWTKDADPSEQIPGIPNQTVQPKPETKHKMDIKPIKFPLLAELASGSPILCIQGKITDLFKPNTGTHAQYGDWVIQNGLITDGTLKHGIAFMDAEHVLPLNFKGKTIRVTAQDYKDKMKGIELKEKEVKGKPNRTVNVRFPSKIEILQADGTWEDYVATPSEGSETSQSTEAQTKPASQPRQTESNMNDSSIIDDPAEQRIADYFKVFDLVCTEAGHDPATEREALNHSDLKEITTGICMSFKGQYGVHRAPIFGSNRTSPGKPTSKPTAKAGATPTSSGEEEAESPARWQDALRKGTRLEDFEPDALSELIQWALDNETPKSPEGRELRPWLIAANEEKKKVASKAVSKKLATAGMGDSFDEEDVDAVCTEEFGGTFAELEYPSLFTLGNQLTGYVTAMKAAWTAKQPKPAVGPKKVAKKPAAASVEDDSDDMPS